MAADGDDHRRGRTRFGPLQRARARQVRSDGVGVRLKDGFEGAVSRANGVGRDFGRDGFVDVIVDGVAVDVRIAIAEYVVIRGEMRRRGKRRARVVRFRLRVLR